MHAIQLIVISLWRRPQHPTVEILVKHWVLDPYSQLLGQSIFKELSYCIAQKFDSGNFDEWPAICQVFPTNLYLLMFFL